tara:strand:+ start:229 stop:564 length:336 start_codon:yes stop_codon:yes gene_type:complete
MKLKLFSILVFFILSLNFNLTYAGGIEEDELAEETSSAEILEITKDYSDNELTTREDIESYQELSLEMSSEADDVCDESSNVVKWSKGCVKWSGGYLGDGETLDIYVRYGS